MNFHLAGTRYIFLYLLLLLGALPLCAQQTPFPLMVSMWDYSNGSGDGTPLGIANWPNGEGSLTVSGVQGTNTLTINSVNVGSIQDYALDTAHNSNNWAIVLEGDDGVYRVYTVSAVNQTGMTLSIHPDLQVSSTAQPASNFYDMYSSPHLTTLGFYGLADFLVRQTKGSSYLQRYASRYVSDGLGDYSGTPWTAIGGLNQGQGGFVPPTNCMTQGVFNYSSTVNGVICNAYSGPDASAVNGSYYQTLLGAAGQGEGASLTANLNGRSGYLDTFVGIEGQYLSEQASARVQVYIDGSLVLNQNFGGLTHIQVPFTHAQSGEIEVTVDSPYPCAPRISNTNWYVWDDAAWNGVSPNDPLLPDGAKILVLMDSWGVWHNAALVTRLAQDLPNATITNVSQDSQTAVWAIDNFSTLTAGGPYDYILSAFQINDLKPGTQGVSFAQLLSNMETLWNLVLNTGATPIYIRSLTTANMPRIQLLNEWDQTLTANYPTQIESQGEQQISFPNPGMQVYGAAPIALAATATSGLPASYSILSGPGALNGNVLSFTGAGTIVVQATQAGNNSWLPAPPVQISISVSPAVLTVTATSTMMTYGGSLPALSYSMTGFVNGDNQGSSTTGAPSITTGATSSSPVGNYAINAAQGTLAATNYTFTFVNGVLAINPATLTVTANNQSMSEGGNFPTFTYTMTGFVNGDTQGTATTGQPNITTDAPNNPPVGTYNIIPSLGTLVATNYTFTFVNGTLTVNAAVAQLTSPTNNSQLGDTTVTFVWTHETGATAYQVWVGATPGGQEYGYCGTTGLTCTLSGLPSNGSTVYATLYGYANNTWSVQDSGQYTAITVTNAQITSPPKGSTLSGTSVTFTWTAESGATAYQVWAGTTPGADDLGYCGSSDLSCTISGLPSNGQPIYVTLYGLSTSWTVQDTASYNAGSAAQITAPTKGSTLTGSAATFTWTSESGATSYQLWIGSTPNSNDIDYGGTSAQTISFSNLPTNGQTLYVTLYGYAGGVWSVQDTATYTAATVANAQIVDPPPGSTLSGDTVTFTWTAETGATSYQLWVGSAPGQDDLGVGGTTGTSTTISNLPTDGSLVYVTLYGYASDTWTVQDQEQYTASGGPSHRSQKVNKIQR